MPTESITLIISIIAILLSAMTGVFSILAYATCVGLEKSTHQVQMVPLDGYGGNTGEDLVNEMNTAFGYDDDNNDFKGQ